MWGCQKCRADENFDGSIAEWRATLCKRHLRFVNNRNKFIAAAEKAPEGSTLSLRDAMAEQE